MEEPCERQNKLVKDLVQKNPTSQILPQDDIIKFQQLAKEDMHANVTLKLSAADIHVLFCGLAKFSKNECKCYSVDSNPGCSGVYKYNNQLTSVLLLSKWWVNFPGFSSFF